MDANDGTTASISYICQIDLYLVSYYKYTERFELKVLLDFKSSLLPQPLDQGSIL